MSWISPESSYTWGPGEHRTGDRLYPRHDHRSTDLDRRHHDCQRQSTSRRNRSLAPRISIWPRFGGAFFVTTFPCEERPRVSGPRVSIAWKDRARTLACALSMVQGETVLTRMTNAVSTSATAHPHPQSHSSAESSLSPCAPASPSAACSASAGSETSG